MASSWVLRWRFIISVLVSPWPPRRPTAPVCCISSRPMSKMRGPMWRMEASSIWSLASEVWACLEKILRIKSTRSQVSIFWSLSASLRL